MDEKWKNILHLFVTVFLSYFATLVVNPTIADVTMEAVCPGQDECSLAIYLTGFQQAIAGLGSVVFMPLIGTLSDAYGRKALLTIPLSFSIIPLVILALKRTTNFFYIYYVLKTFTSMVTEGGLVCLSLSYLADNVSEGKRVSAFGLLGGVVSAANVCGTLAARLLPTNRIFQVAAVSSVVAAVYMRLFLKETTKTTTTTTVIDDDDASLNHPLLKPQTDQNEPDINHDKPLIKAADVVKKIPLPKEVMRLLNSSSTTSLLSFVAFFNSLADAGVQAFLMYYLKARFHFHKDQFADIWLITYIGATISNMIVMPTLGPLMGEETLLCIGLFAGFANMLLYSIAWTSWVPYVIGWLSIFLFLSSPCIRCIISKQVGPYEQGIAQGCLMGIASFANVISPLIFSPLSALFFSEAAPFHFTGFSMLCVGIAYFVGFVLSTMIKLLPRWSRGRVGSEQCTLA